MIGADAHSHLIHKLVAENIDVFSIVLDKGDLLVSLSDGSLNAG